MLYKSNILNKVQVFERIKDDNTAIDALKTTTADSPYYSLGGIATDSYM